MYGNAISAASWGRAAPTLLVWGERDRLVPARVAEEWQRFFRGRGWCGCRAARSDVGGSARARRCVLAFLGDQLLDDPGEEAGLRVGDGVGLAGDDDEAATG